MMEDDIHIRYQPPSREVSIDLPRALCGEPLKRARWVMFHERWAATCPGCRRHAGFHA